jgi:hypothetical protein
MQPSSRFFFVVPPQEADASQQTDPFQQEGELKRKYVRFPEVVVSPNEGVSAAIHGAV